MCCLEISEFGQELATSASMAFIQCIDHYIYKLIRCNHVPKRAIDIVEGWLSSSVGVLQIQLL